MRIPSLFRQCTAGIVAAVFLLSPVSTLAERATSFEAEALVSRGDFIRAAVKEFGFSAAGNQDIELPYADVPQEYLPYIRVAQKERALEVFKGELYPTRAITRGEALRVVVNLLDLRSQKGVYFRDVRRGTMEEKAVRVAVDQQLLQPITGSFFGIRRRLNGMQAEELLSAASGSEDGGTSTIETPTIRVRFNGGRSRSGAGVAQGVPKNDLFNSVWRSITRDYLYDEKIDSDAAAYDAIESMVGSLEDPYTRFLRPVQNKNFQTQINGKVSGIGAQVEDRGGILTIVTPLTGSPAERAGLKPNDQIISVDGEAIEGMQFMEAVEKVRGPRGSRVQLGIRRNSVQLTITVVRDIVRVPEIEISWQGKVAVVKLMQFGKLTETELRSQLNEVQQKDPKGIILDLRNNPGGLLNAASVVMSNFVPLGTTVAKIESRADSRIERTHEQPTVDVDIPLIVLVNEGSASASEIVAGALQEHNRATVIGDTTFGKGTVQSVMQFTDGSSLKMTVAEWFTPKGRKIDTEGIEPDIQIDYASDRDEQMLKALDILR